MGTFQVAIEMGDAAGERWETVDVVVDTGASYSWIPADVLHRRGVQPQFRRRFRTADDRSVERDMAVTAARWDGQVLPTLVVFADAGSLAVLGAHSLEGFSLAADPVNRRLIPVEGFALLAGCGDSSIDPAATSGRVRTSRLPTIGDGLTVCGAAAGSLSLSAS